MKRAAAAVVSKNGSGKGGKRAAKGFVKDNTAIMQEVRQKDREIQRLQQLKADELGELERQAKAVQDHLSDLDNQLGCSEELATAQQYSLLEKKLELQTELEELTDQRWRKTAEWRGKIPKLTAQELSVLRGIQAMKERQKEKREKAQLAEQKNQRLQDAKKAAASTKPLQEEQALVRRVKEKYANAKEMEQQREAAMQKLAAEGTHLDEHIEAIQLALTKPDISKEHQLFLMEKKLEMVQAREALNEKHRTAAAYWEGQQISFDPDELRVVRGLRAKDEERRRKQAAAAAAAPSGDNSPSGMSNVESSQQPTGLAAVNREAELLRHVKQKLRQIEQQKAERKDELAAFAERRERAEHRLASAQALDDHASTNSAKLEAMDAKMEAMGELEELAEERSRWLQAWKERELKLNNEEERIARGIKAQAHLASRGTLAAASQANNQSRTSAEPVPQLSDAELIRRARAKLTLSKKLEKLESDTREALKMSQKTLKLEIARIGEEVEQAEGAHHLLEAYTLLEEKLAAATRMQDEEAEISRIDRHRVYRDELLALDGEEARVMRGLRALRTQRKDGKENTRGSPNPNFDAVIEGRGALRDGGENSPEQHTSSSGAGTLDTPRCLELLGITLTDDGWLPLPPEDVSGDALQERSGDYSEDFDEFDQQDSSAMLPRIVPAQTKHQPAPRSRIPSESRHTPRISADSSPGGTLGASRTGWVTGGAVEIVGGIDQLDKDGTTSDDDAGGFHLPRLSAAEGPDEDDELPLPPQGKMSSALSMHISESGFVDDDLSVSDLESDTDTESDESDESEDERGDCTRSRSSRGAAYLELSTAIRALQATQRLSSSCLWQSGRDKGKGANGLGGSYLVREVWMDDASDGPEHGEALKSLDQELSAELDGFMRSYRSSKVHAL
eukprot:NODE_158_length_2968_cov_41.937307_g145_i0.p1 GENE.NODE_158_length_2968_cov_41.937307_g145_i0~~NODE_158_length_2968_cov_41.937307_g145_i0.p1  ORF type:complete len:907 (+),score=249.88 NODE_158_length_2968_cov_41.937307_g145_i0:55-2775(+)